jgi:phosphoglycolate phosphatase
VSAVHFNVEAVLFDLDGTLVDSLPDIAETANRMLAEIGRPARELAQIGGFVGKGIPNLVERCLTEGASATHEQIDAAIMVFRRHYAVVNGECSRVFPGVLETLEAMRARGLKLACVTNKPEVFTLPLLERTGLAPYFDLVVGGDTLAVKKPDPAMLRFACERLGTRRALMIGDSINDAQAARAAGLPVLLVTYGYSVGMPVDTIECDGLLSDAREALALLGNP